MDSESLLETISNIASYGEPESDPVERKKIGKILESGRQAPSPGNVQSKEFIVVENKFKKQSLSDLLDDERVEKSPTLILIITDDNRMRRKVGQKYDRFAESEAATAVQNMRLMAQACGLSSIWLDGFDSESARSLFDIPESHSVRSMLCLAYSEDRQEVQPRFGLNETAFYDEFGNQVNSQFDKVHWRGLREESRIVSKKKEGLKSRVRRRLSNIIKE